MGMEIEVGVKLAKGTDDAGYTGADEEDDLQRIVAGVEVLLRDGYRLVADRSLERRMTQQRA
jgi:hypothetical protein